MQSRQISLPRQVRRLNHGNCQDKCEDTSMTSATEELQVIQRQVLKRARSSEELQHLRVCHLLMRWHLPLSPNQKMATVRTVTHHGGRCGRAKPISQALCVKDMAARKRLNRIVSMFLEANAAGELGCILWHLLWHRLLIRHKVRRTPIVIRQLL